MPTYPLPVNIDATYADSGTDASQKLHQQYHDQIHGKANAAADIAADFGASTSSSTNNVAIQAAIDAGVPVFVPPGTWEISQIIQPKSNMVLFGIPGLSIIRAKTTYTPTPLVTDGFQVLHNGSTTLTNVTIDGITFDGGETTGTTSATYEPNSHCVDLRNVTGLVVRNVSVRNAIRYSLYLQGCSKFLIEGCDLLTGQAGITPARQQQDGIHVTTSSAGRIVHNHVVTNGPNNVGDDGIVVRSPLGATLASRDITIANNVISSDQSGIKLVGDTVAMDVKNIVVANNVIYDTWGGAINLDGYANFTGKFRGITIKGNVARNMVGSDTHVIRIGSSGTASCFDTVSIEGNVIDGVAQRSAHAIVAEWGDHLTIAGNMLRDVATDRGIMVGSVGKPVTHFAVHNNIVDMTSSTVDNHIGIYIGRSARGAVSGNVIHGKKASGTNDTNPGILLTGDATNGTTDVTVTGNTVYDAAVGIKEQNGGTSEDYNVIVANAVRTCTTGVSKLGTNTISANNV